MSDIFREIFFSPYWRASTWDVEKEVANLSDALKEGLRPDLFKYRVSKDRQHMVRIKLHIFQARGRWSVGRDYWK